MMNALFPGLVFSTPLVLWALAVLPAVWFLLRVMPPRPRVIVLPTVRFLEGLIPERVSPSHTPWWILLLRLLMLTLLILALAGPVLNPGSKLGQAQGLRLVIDNGWSAAPLWEIQIREAENAIAEAERLNIPVLLLPTAALSAEPAESPRLLPAAEARAALKGLLPRPWESDMTALAEQVKILPGAEGGYKTLWLGDGLSHKGIQLLADALAQGGDITFFHPQPEALALTLRIKSSLKGPEIQVQSAVDSGAMARKVSVQALASDGRVLGFQDVDVDGPSAAPVFFDMPEAVRGQVVQYRLTALPGAGGVFLMDGSFQRRAVGIVAAQEKSENAPLVEAGYYLRRALEPYADLAFGSAAALTRKDRSLIILPDIGSMPLEDLNALEDWVHGGGLLLRFAGPSVAGNVANMSLVPVPLRAGGRALEGSLTWETPLHIKEFSPASPLAGLEVPKDVLIRQQVLADPAESLEGKVWASLEDGTPLITASPYGKGLLVMIHTTASADWSDLPLSGVFVDILRRLAALSAAPSRHADTKSDIALDPLTVLDGFGAFRKPDASVKPIGVADMAKGIAVDPAHPPGIYGRPGLQMALNLGERAPVLRPAPDLGAHVLATLYGQTFEWALTPMLLALAGALALLDWGVMIGLGMILRWQPGNILALLAVLGFFAFSSPVARAAEGAEVAASASANDLRYAGALYLAYVQTGDAALDGLSRAGLENLAQELTSRTSAEPAGVAAVDIEHDPLAFFPWLYWPVSEGQKPPGPGGLQKIQDYLDHGGTILFDLRYGAGQNTEADKALQKITGALNIPPLMPLPAEHVLTRTFYLLDSFPGLYTTGVLWVEKGSVSGRDGVSSVIIGSNDWASAWAAGAHQGGLPGGSRQGEMAIRAGINFTMYALTGNYKTDQVHVPYILERLGR